MAFDAEPMYWFAGCLPKSTASKAFSSSVFSIHINTGMVLHENQLACGHVHAEEPPESEPWEKQVLFIVMTRRCPLRGRQICKKLFKAAVTQKRFRQTKDDEG